MLDPATKTTSRFDPIRLFFTYKGRINRQQYVLGWLILVGLYLPLSGLFIFISNIIPFYSIWIVSQIGFIALFIIPHFFIMIKRFHDFDTSGRFTLFILFPFLGQLIALPILILMSVFIKGTTAANRHNQDLLSRKRQPQYCKNCSATIKQHSSFCSSCGENLAR